MELRVWISSEAIDVIAQEDTLAAVVRQVIIQENNVLYIFGSDIIKQWIPFPNGISITI